MTTIGIIPARYGSSRFPGKPLAHIAGKPMIQWVYEGAKKSECLDQVYVATDDKRIYDVVEGFGGRCLMTSSKHDCGTDRIAECSKLLGLSDSDIVVNIQGDEPLVQASMIDTLVGLFDDEDVEMGTLKSPISCVEELRNPNIVKIETTLSGWAITFSRSLIPFNRDRLANVGYFRHVGMYAYRVSFLSVFVSLPKSGLEQAECLEQMRAVENGYRIKVAEVACVSPGVDTPEQLRVVEKLIFNEVGN